jgi:hypothetical protein
MAKKKDKKAGTSAKVSASEKVESKVEAKPAGPDSPAPKGWRATLPIHPAAELFPLMSPAELKDLAEDIKKSGVLANNVVVWRENSDSPRQLLDGRNRLDAIEIAEEGPIDPMDYAEELNSSVDPYAYVISANIKRRHLTAKQKRELIKKLLKERPEKSNRQIAEAVKVHHGTVGAVRDEMEGRGEISHVETRTDTKGRDQPARKGAGKGAKGAGKGIKGGGKGIKGGGKGIKGGGKGGGAPKAGEVAPATASETAGVHARNEEVELAAAFAALISIDRKFQLSDLPKDVGASNLFALAERIELLAAEVERLAKETVH